MLTANLVLRSAKSSRMRFTTDGKRRYLENIVVNFPEIVKASVIACKAEMVPNYICTVQRMHSRDIWKLALWIMLF